MPIWCKHITEPITTGDRQGAGDIHHIQLHTARNAIASAQVCIRDIEDLHIKSIALVGVPEGVIAEHHFRDSEVFNDGIPYPDRLTHREAMTVKAHVNQVLLITFRVLPDAPVGAHTVELVMKTQHGTCGAFVTLHIHKTVLPEPKDSVFAHEYMLNYARDYAYDNHTPKATPFPDVARYSDAWWQIMASQARALKDMRCNVLNVEPFPLLGDGGSKRIGETEWHLDFSLFDRYVETYLANGSFKYIAIASVIRAVDGKDIRSVDENGKAVWMPIFEPATEAWANQFYSAIYRHFEEKGWLNMLIMRLEDEPHTTEYWDWARGLCRKHMPGIICGEPIDVHAISKELTGRCDQYIPRFDIYAEDPAFYRGRQAAGDQVWCYVCCFPEEHEWLNKFIDRPVAHSRLIYWACYAQGITGFLHWGLNHWSVDGFGMYPGARFKGDGYIVYPDAEHNAVTHSIRSLASGEGLQDVELFYMLEKKHAPWAKAMAYRIARAFNDYTDDAKELDRAREEMLMLLD